MEQWLLLCRLLLPFLCQIILHFAVMFIRILDLYVDNTLMTKETVFLSEYLAEK
jgi:hypothetical protein